MIYVDENLCSGCGSCLDVCTRGAIAIQGSVAHVDENACTECGACINSCPAEAIIEVEMAEQTPGSVVLPRAADVPSVTRPVSISKLERAGKVLSGLFALVSFAYELKQNGIGARSAQTGTGRGLRGRMRAGGRELGPGRGPGTGRGRMGGGGGRCDGTGRNRTIQKREEHQ